VGVFFRANFAIAIVLMVSSGGVAIADPVEVEYTYDALGRVIKVTQSDGQLVTYTYDKAGNRTSHQVSGGRRGKVVALPLLGGLVLPIR
jgi:YD repeat-containing protein